MKSIFVKLLIAIPVIYLALFISLWSSVTDNRPLISLIDMMRSDSAIMAIFTFIPNILLMPIYLVLQQLQMMHTDTLKEMALCIPWDMR